MGYPYEISAYDTNGNRICKFGCWRVDGSFDNGESYYENYTIVEDDSGCFVYYSDEGWLCGKTIIITEEPSPKVATWIRANATKKETVGTWIFGGFSAIIIAERRSDQWIRSK